MSRISHLIEEMLMRVPVGVLIFRGSNLVWANPQAANMLEIPSSTIGEKVAPFRDRSARSIIEGNGDVLSLPNGTARVLTFSDGCYHLCLLVRVSNLSHVDRFFLTVPFAIDVLSQVLLSPDEGLVVVDSQGALKYLSPTCETLLGVEVGAGIGRPVTDLIPKTSVHEVARTGKSKKNEIRLINGRERIISARPVKKDGLTLGAVSKIAVQDVEKLRSILNSSQSVVRPLNYYRHNHDAPYPTSIKEHTLVGCSKTFLHLRAMIEKAAATDLPVLILGETGTGKEIVAREIHRLSKRCSKPFVTVNCPAIPQSLFESELFGYHPGAFTSATKEGKKGKIELAEGGTLFLDEIGDLPMEAQSKILRAVQDGQIEKLGSTRLTKIDFRLICATNKPHDFLTSSEYFRQDLFYRISAITIFVPPLRERTEDIPLLLQHFIERSNEKYGTSIKGVSEEALGALCRYDWPGNIRQLENEVYRACWFADDDILKLDHFSELLQARVRAKEGSGSSPESRAFRLEVLSSKWREQEKDRIEQALVHTRGNKAKAARILGMSRTTLYKKMRDFGLLFSRA